MMTAASQPALWRMPLKRPPPACDVRLQHGVDRLAQAEVAIADDAGTGAQPERFGARGHGGDVFGLAHRPQFLRPVGAIGEAALDEHGGPHVVARRQIGAQLIEQVAAGRTLPQMMVRIDDRQRRIDDVLAQLREPRLIDVRMWIRLCVPDCRAHGGLPAWTAQG